MTASLAGVRVVEIGIFMAGPFAAMQLADLGADVIKIENPAGGDPTRQIGPFVEGESAPFARLNRNKRSVALDLKTAEGKRALVELAQSADILIENLRPGAMAKLGLDYTALAKDCPRLIYVSASGWGQDGPLATHAGLDIMAQARSGLMSITGSPDDGHPAKVGVPVCDLVCGLYGAMGALAALRHREQSGTGQHVDVSLFEAGVSLGVWEAARYFTTGEVGGPLGSAHQSTAPYQALRCSDGWVTVGAVTPKTWTAFCDLLGLDELRNDPRYESAFGRQSLRHELIPAIEQATVRWSKAELVAELERAGVPCAPIATYDQVFTDEHLNARDFFWDSPHPTMGSVRQIGSPMRLSETPPARGSAGPLLGADTYAVLDGLGWPPGEIEKVANHAVIGAES